MKSILLLFSLFIYSPVMYACEVKLLLKSWGISEHLEKGVYMQEAYSLFTEDFTSSHDDGELLRNIFQSNYEDFKRIAVQRSFPNSEIETEFSKEICSSFNGDEIQRLVEIDEILKKDKTEQADRLILKEYRNSDLMKKELVVRKRLLKILVNNFSQVLMVFGEHLNNKYTNCTFSIAETTGDKLKMRVLCG